MDTWPIPEYPLQVALGRVYNATSYQVHGENPDVDTGTEDVWSQGGTWAPPTAARVHAIVSSSVNDAGGGTGARTMQVWGLNAAGSEVTETVALTGQVPVNTANSYLYIRKMRVLTAGSGGTNAGVITATATVDNTVSSAIPIGLGESHEATFMVPSGYTALVVSWWCSVQGGGTTRVDAALVGYTTAGNARVEYAHVAVQVGGTSSFRQDYPFPLSFPALTIVKIRATSGSDNADVHAGMNILLVPL
jgi:hypothetical protein